jgi:hypothetical protein
MATSDTEVPPWLKRALLGVCYWMGHRRSLYREYPLGEAALVAELCNLLFANLPPGLKLVCEVQYSKFVEVQEHESEFTEKSRVDLCVCGPICEGDELLNHVTFALEVKRGSASSASVDGDLRRLLQMRRARPEIRAFLLLISEQRRPTRFVNPRSFAVKKKILIEHTDGHCRVRTVMKAVPLIRSLDRAHYGCAVEVLLPSEA